MKKQIGDVFAMPTAKGEAYMQYTFEYTDPPVYGSLIRIFMDDFDKTPEELEEVIKKHTNYWTFCQVYRFAHRKVMRRVGNYPIPEHSQKFPLFRSSNHEGKNRTMKDWYLWDGKKDVFVKEITKEQLKLPLHMLESPINIKMRLEKNIRPEDRMW